MALGWTAGWRDSIIWTWDIRLVLILSTEPIPFSSSDSVSTLATAVFRFLAERDGGLAFLLLLLDDR
jgi:hypothetical protein